MEDKKWFVIRKIECKPYGDVSTPHVACAEHPPKMNYWEWDYSGSEEIQIVIDTMSIAFKTREDAADYADSLLEEADGLAWDGGLPYTKIV